MLAGLELEDDLQQLVKFLDNWFKFQIDHSYDMTDVVATTNINVHGAKPARKTIFPGRRRLSDKREGDVKYIPGVGKVRIVPNLDWDD